MVVSPPPSTWSQVGTQEGFRALRRAAEAEAKACGLRGGAFIFHPLRIPSRWNERDRCAEGPHFHVLGDGWMRPSSSGWVVRNLGVRKSVRGTAAYLLSHAGQPVRKAPRAARSLDGILPKREVSGERAPIHGVVWAGSMSYAALSGLPDRSRAIRCPVCEAEVPFGEWRRAEWLGEGPPPEGSGTCEVGAWRVVAALDRTASWARPEPVLAEL